MAAGRIDDDTLAALATCLGRMRSAASESERIGHDADFHVLVATASGNATLASMLAAVSSRTIRARAWRGIVEENAGANTMLQHQEILRALEDRDPSRAEAAALLHVATTEAVVPVGHGGGLAAGPRSEWHSIRIHRSGARQTRPLIGPWLRGGSMRTSTSGTSRTGPAAWPTPAEGDIYHVLPEDLEPELHAAGINETVLVQTVDALDDTDAMLAAARRHPFIAGVVGWIPLADRARAEAALDARAGESLCGIRHLIHFESDSEWLLRPDVADGLRLLTERRLTFDVVAVFPEHLRLVPAVADRHPDLVLVIDHLAKPPFCADGWDRWLRELRQAAARPNVMAKVSGLDTAAGPDWDIVEIQPAIAAAVDAFGTHRLMFGSDWPVCRLASTYRQVV